MRYSNELTVFNKADLVKRLEAYDRKASIGLALEGLIILLLVYLIHWAWIFNNLFVSLLLFGLVGGGSLLGFARIFFQNKKAVQNLRVDAQIGMYSKQQLLDLVTEVFSKMNIGQNDARVFITAEKQLNAYALQVGLGTLFKKFRYVFINKSALHCLNPAELKTVLAHELAHIFRYPTLWGQFFLFHTFTYCLFGLLVLQWLAPRFGVEMALMAVIFAIFLVQVFVSYFLGFESHVIEHLCDDEGAKVGGVVPAINCELKLGQRSEAYTKVMCKALEIKLNGGPVSSKELLAIFEQSCPYGSLNPETLQKEIEFKISSKEEKSGSMSMKGFMQYLFFMEGTDTGTALENQLEQLKLPQKFPKIDLDLQENGLNLEQIKELVTKIESNPGHLLFHLPEEVEDQSLSHPGARRRILYLWKNRDAYV